MLQLDVKAHDREATLKLREELGRKFTPEDVENGPMYLAAAADEYARNYEGTFEYMVSMRDAVLHYGTLTVRQASGTLNCLVAEMQRKDRPAPEGKTVALAMVPNPGYYTIAFNDGHHTTLRVRPGTDDFSGKLILGVMSGPDNVNNYYNFGDIDTEKGTIRYWKSRSGNPLTERGTEAFKVLLRMDDDRRIEAGKAYAAESGNCYVCGRLLTTPESIAKGIGPICEQAAF